MDELFRKSNFENLSKRLDDAKKAVGENMRLKAVHEKANQIQEKVEDLSDSKEHVMLFGLLILLLVLSLVGAYIKMGFDLKWIILLIVILAFLLYYRFTMKTAEEKNKVFSNYSDDPDENQAFYKRTKFLSSSIQLKRTRIQLTRIFYVFFFPLFLLLMKASVGGSDRIFSNPILYIGLAILFGSIFWYFFFRSEVQELNITQTDLSNIEEEFASGN